MSGFPGVDDMGSESEAFLSLGDPVVHISNEKFIL